jgi:hypothetical protein
MDQESILKGAARAVGVAEVVDGGAARVDALLERLDHAVVERLDLRALQRPDRPQRMDAGAEERLVRVDVAHAGYALLREQEGLDRRPAAAGDRPERLWGELRTERLHPEPAREVLLQRVRAEQ